MLQGNVLYKDLQDKCNIANKEQRTTKWLKDVTWKCHSCDTAQQWSGFFRGGTDGEKDPLWQKKYSKFVLQPGALRECLRCRNEQTGEVTFICQCCQRSLTKEHYSSAAWNKKTITNRRKLCISCTRPACTAQDCKTCKVCRDPQCTRRKCNAAIKPLHAKQLPASAAELTTWMCMKCRSITCSTCQKSMPVRIQQKKRARQSLSPYKCGECRTAEVSMTDIKNMQ